MFFIAEIRWGDECFAHTKRVDAPFENCSNGLNEILLLCLQRNKFSFKTIDRVLVSPLPRGFKRLLCGGHLRPQLFLRNTEIKLGTTCQIQAEVETGRAERSGRPLARRLR